MKMIQILLALGFVFSAHAIKTSPYSNAYNNDGTVKHYDKVTVKVKNDTGSAISAGSVLVLDVTADDGIEVTTSSNDWANPHCVTEVAIADGALADCLVYGYTDKLLFNASTTAVAGGSAYVDTGVAGYSRFVATGSVGSYFVKVGTFLDASSASGSVEAFINLL